jgi:hypothetical protein
LDARKASLRAMARAQQLEQRVTSDVTRTASN